MNSKYIKVSLLAYLFLFKSVQSFSQYTPAWEESFYEEIIQLRLDTGHEPATPEGAYVKGFKLGMKNLLQDSPSPGAVSEQLDIFSSVIEMSDTPEPYRQYYLNDLFLFRALMELKEGSEVKFMWMMNQLYRKSSSLAERNPDFLPAQKLDALMEIMVGSVPDQYQWIFSLLGFEGNIDKGLKQLNLLSEYNGNVKDEGTALYYLITNYLQPELSGPGNKRLSKEIRQNDNKQLLQFIAGLSYIKQHQSLKAREVFIDLSADRDFPIIDYFIAETYLHEGITQKAITHYKQFLQNNKGENLVKDSYFKIYLCHYINNKYKDADKYKAMAISMGEVRSEADKNAERLLHTEPLPDPLIFKIRFLTDGGFFREAQELIREVKSSDLSEKDKIEFIYRRARVSHLSGKTDAAINEYKMSIKHHDGRYFAPNACLQLGYLYEKRKDVELARHYFEKVLDYKNYTYENSLRSKAKSALKSLNNTD